jgi:type IV secretory pathway VirJ component
MKHVSKFYGTTRRSLCAIGIFFGMTTSLANAAPPGVNELPLVEVSAIDSDSDTLAIIVTGDGGWAGLAKTVAGVLTDDGIPVVGLSSLKYFWKAKTPEQAALALETISRHYLELWGKNRILLIGYSRGADLLPFMTTRLPQDLQQRVDIIALLGPATITQFKVHIPEWLPRSHDDDIATLPEINKLDEFNVLCVYGDDEEDSACPLLANGLAVLEKRPGGHHFDGDYEFVAARILEVANN